MDNKIYYKFNYKYIKNIIIYFGDFDEIVKFIIPDSIKQRTQLYLELSCNILTWFKDNYDKTETKIDIIKLEDLFSDFKESDYYYNLTKK